MMLPARALLIAVLAPMFAVATEFNGEVLNGAQLRAAAVELGKQIDAARAEDKSSATVERWLRASRALDQRAREARQHAEGAAGENEQALERLYRSSNWAGLNFALAASRYWQSWLYLDQFALSASPSDISAARHGFQTTLVLIVYPGLVRGSWLGLGYVALAEEDLPQARVWFDRVALQGDALADTARRELDLLNALEQPAVAAVDALDAAAADALETQALALLKRHGKTLDGARAAAERLQQLEAAGAMTLQMVQRLLLFRDEIIGQRIGPVGYLVSAEHALDNGQYYTSVQKYEAFFAALDDVRADTFADYRLRYAEALLLSGLYQRAVSELAPRLDQFRDQGTALSLLHLAHAMPFAARGGEFLRREYLLAAENARDAGAAFSRQLLGKHLRAASAQAQSARRENNLWFMRLPTFELVYREFAVSSEAKLRDAQAQLGLQLARQLDKETRSSPWSRLAVADMQAQLEPDTTRVLLRLDKLAAEFAKEDVDRRDQLLRIRLAYLKERDPALLIETLGTLQPPLSAAMGLQLLGVMLPCAERPWCLSATQHLRLLYKSGSDAYLTVQLEHIRLLSASARDMDAFEESKALITAYPTSGDAWQLYARSCERVGRVGDADQAYAHLARAVPMGSIQWRDTQLARLNLRLAAGADEEACALRQAATLHPQTLAQLDAVLADRNVSCSSTNTLL